MQKCLFILLLFIYPLSASFRAQPANLGCDGLRYKQDVFTEVKKTTVDYAPTLSHTGLAMTLKMDVYEPQNDNATVRPVVILAHGGSFIFGDRTMMESWCQVLARKGYVAATIQYRLYPVFTLGFPDSTDIFDAAIKAVGDMKAAVRYFREDASTANLFHVDPTNIFIGGYSAGAVAALHAAYLDESDAISPFMQAILDANGSFEGLSGTTSNQTYSSSAKAVLNMSGGLYRSELIGAESIPMAGIHGTADETVPYLSGIAAGIAYLEGSGLLHPQAQGAGVWSYLETVPDGGHSDIYDAPQFAANLNNFIATASDLLESLVCASSGADDPAAGETDFWTLGPNPAQVDLLQVFLPDNLPAANVFVFNSAGQLALRRENVSGALPIGQLPAGVYSVRISDPRRPEKTFATRRLVRL